MSKSRIIITLAACVALLPFLGFPNSWESFFQVAAGLSIIAASVWATIDRKLKLQAKAQMRQARKVVEPAVEVSAPVVPEEDLSLAKRATDFYPKTGQPGRRASDLNPTLPVEEN